MEEFINEIKKDKEVSEFASKLSYDEVEMNITLLLSQVRANKICANCKGKKPCESDVFEMQSRLVKNTSIVSREYFDCPYRNNVEDEIELVCFPNQDAPGEPFPRDDRNAIYEEIQEYLKSDGQKGFYFYGSFGTGKTFLLKLIADKLAKKGKKVIISYYPELTRYAKSCIGDGTLEKLIVKLKNIDVLMLDDIGGEMTSAFIRDEFLGPILQYRMMMHKPVFMSSNYDLNTLEKVLCDVKNEENTLKAERIMERIMYLMKPIQLTGPNFRR